MKVRVLIILSWGCLFAFAGGMTGGTSCVNVVVATCKTELCDEAEKRGMDRKACTEEIWRKNQHTVLSRFALDAKDNSRVLEQRRVIVPIGTAREGTCALTAEDINYREVILGTSVEVVKRGSAGVTVKLVKQILQGIPNVLPDVTWGGFVQPDCCALTGEFEVLHNQPPRVVWICASEMTGGDTVFVFAWIGTGDPK